MDEMKKLEFKSLQLCGEFYKLYSQAKGFGVREKGARKSRIDQLPTSRILKCSAEGLRDQKHLNNPDRKRKPKEITRFNCKAEIRFKWIRETNHWIVTDFVAEHTHPLASKDHVLYIRSNRKIPDKDKTKIEEMHEGGAPPRIIMRTLVNQAGSHKELGFLKDDVKNHIKKVKREKYQDGDAENVMAYLRGKKQVDPTFFLRYTLDDKGRLENLFWCDRKSRIDYKTFGHVLVFDTTYKCNVYNLPLVVLVGVNHNRKTVPFGCAIVADEKESSFIWVLEQLIEAGDGQKPETVLTDGDKAMANAIEVVFPEARHRLCLWHLIRNVRANGGDKFCSGFTKCVNKYRTPNDFQKGWDELVSHYGVKDKKWAIDLYNDSAKWAEAYLRGYFFAGMRSTQRCEGMNRLIKTPMNPNIKLCRLVELHDQVVEDLRVEDGHCDYKTIHTFPLIDGVMSNIKLHAAEAYTRNCYELLCNEMAFESMYVVKGEEQEDDGSEELIYYWLNEVDHENVWYIVIRHDAHDMMYCCCMKLESVGFPCRHMFAVMKYANMKRIPTGCILRRWTIGAKEHIKLKDDATADHEEGDVIKDPNVITGIGAPKGKRRITCGKCHNPGHTQRKYPRDASAKSEGKKPIIDLDLNKSYTTSHQHSINTSQKNVSSNNATSTRKLLMSYMPEFYTNGDILRVEYIEEVEKLDKDPKIVDWSPKQEW